MTKPQESDKPRSSGTRRKLLEAAVQEFFHRGQHDVDPFAHVTFAAISRATGIGRSSIRYHWPPRDEFAKELAQFLLGADLELFEDDFRLLQDTVRSTSDLCPLDRLAR